MSEKRVCVYCGVGLEEAPHKSCPEESIHRQIYQQDISEGKRKILKELIGTPLDPLFDGED